MECKLNTSHSQTLKGRELIDTLWNVNKGSGTAEHTVREELIDTLWNVNSSGRSLRQS